MSVEKNDAVLRRFHFIVDQSFKAEVIATNQALHMHKQLLKKFSQDVYVDSVNLWAVRKTLAISRAHRVFVYKAAEAAEAALKSVWGVG